MARSKRFSRLMALLAVTGVGVSMFAAGVYAQQAPGGAAAAGAAAAPAPGVKKEDPSPLLKLSSGPLETGPVAAAGADAGGGSAWARRCGEH